MKKSIFFGILAAVLLSACTRIETGEVGLRIGFDKQVSSAELQPGSFNQVLVGDVITFPVREIKVAVDNRHPITADNSALADFDFTVIYSITPSSVSELWTTKSRGFHVFDEKRKDWILMQNYVETIANSAAFKAVRKHEVLKINDARAQIEQDIKTYISQSLAEEKLQASITINQVQVRSAEIDKSVADSAAAVIRSQNELKAKQVDVQTAQQEAQRIAALNANAKAIDYMNAQAQYKIAEAIAAGKVSTIVVPYDFKGIVNVK